MFQVLRCFKCEVFQVHQVKKSNRWQCKMCNEKQSHKRRYGLGTAKECRVHVQKLNSLRGNIESSNENVDSLSDKNESEKDEVEDKKIKYSGQSKWSSFVSEEESEHEEEPNSTMYLNNVEVVLEAPKRSMKRKFGKNSFDNTPKKFKKQHWNQKYNDADSVEDTIDEPEAQSTVETIKVELKPKPKQKFVPPKVSAKTKTPSDKSSKWDDFTIGHVDNDSGLMYLDSQYQKTRLGDQPPPESYPTKINCGDHVPKATKINSKWGQYIDDEKISQSAEKFKNIFSLCDDNELDDVLNL